MNKDQFVTYKQHFAVQASVTTADEAGMVIGVPSAEYPDETPQPLWSEQEPSVWWKATKGYCAYSEESVV